MYEKIYISFSEMKLHVFFTSHKKFRFFLREIDFLKNFQRKSEEKSHQMKNYFKNSENFTMCVLQ